MFFSILAKWLSYARPIENNLKCMKIKCLRAKWGRLLAPKCKTENETWWTDNGFIGNCINWWWSKNERAKRPMDNFTETKLPTQFPHQIMKKKVMIFEKKSRHFPCSELACAYVFTKEIFEFGGACPDRKIPDFFFLDPPTHPPLSLPGTPSWKKNGHLLH